MKAIASYVIWAEVFAGCMILAVFWPDEPCTLRAGLLQAVTGFGRWLWSRHPGRHQRGPGRREIRRVRRAAA